MHHKGRLQKKNKSQLFCSFVCVVRSTHLDFNFFQMISEGEEQLIWVECKVIIETELSVDTLYNGCKCVAT